MSDSAMVKNEYGKGIKGVGQGGGPVVLNRIIKQGLTHRWCLCKDLEEVKKRTNMNILGESIQPEKSIRSKLLRQKHDQSVCGTAGFVFMSGAE